MLIPTVVVVCSSYKERMDKIVAYHNATPVGPGTRKDANGNLLYGIDSSNGTDME